MATQDEIFRIQMRTVGESQVVQAAAKVANATKGAADAAELWVDKQGKLRNRMGQFATDAQRAAAAAGAYGDEMQKAAAASAAAAKGVAKAGEAGRGGSAGMNRFGMAAMQLSSIMDDVRYGARGIQNNVSMLIASMGKFSPVATIMGGVASSLIGVFRKQVDAGLAWAGVLDENLVKGMERAEQGAERMTSAVERLTERLKDAPAAAKEAGEAMAKAFEGSGAGGRGQMVEQLISEGFGSGRTREIEERIARGEALSGRVGFFQRRNIQANISADRDRLVEARKQQRADAQAEIEGLIASAAGGDAGASARLSGLARRSGQVDFAAEVDRQRGLPGPEIAEQMGPGRDVLEQGLKDREQTDRLIEESNKALAEARKVSTEAAFGGIIGLETRVDRGIKGRLAAGIGLGDAQSQVAGNLAAELQSAGGLPADWAAEEAQRYVDERAKALREDAGREAVDRATMTDEERQAEAIRDRLAQMGLQPGPSGAASVVDAGSFVQQVQAGGAKDPAKLMQDQLQKLETLIGLQKDAIRALERGGLLGA